MLKKVDSYEKGIEIWIAEGPTNIGNKYQILLKSVVEFYNVLRNVHRT